MKLRILWLGKTKNPNLAAVCEELATRSNHFVGTEITELKEPRIKEEKKRVALEGERLLSVIVQPRRLFASPTQTPSSASCGNSC